VPHVERHHASCPTLEQDVGESAGRSAEVEAVAPRHGDPERVEGVRQLHASAADVRVIGDREGDTGRLVHGGPRFRHRLPFDDHVAREDQGAGALPRRRQTAIDEQLIEANAGHRRVA
jgi:hypothetical protein